MRSVLMTLVAAFALLAFAGTQVYAAPRGGHSAGKHHASHAKKGGKKSKKGGMKTSAKKGEHKEKGERKERKERERRGNERRR